MYLQTPKVFQSLMVLSLEPETIWRLSEEKATLRTSLVWPTKRRVVVPLKKTETMGDLAEKSLQGGGKIQIFEGKRNTERFTKGLGAMIPFLLQKNNFGEGLGKSG